MAISTEAKMLESEAVSWFQTKEDIHVRNFVPKGTKKAQVKVVSNKQAIFVNIPPGSSTPVITDPPKILHPKYKNTLHP